MSRRAQSALQDRVVLITGAARGIGASCAHQFARLGAHVAICDIDVQAAEDVRRKIEADGGIACVWHLDVRDRGAWNSVLDDIRHKWRGVDILIGNAGIMPVGKALEIDERIDIQQVDINLHGVIAGVRAVLPSMLKRNDGHIINIASLAGRIPTPYAAVYAATKFAVVGFSESMRHELTDTNVDITVVMPGLVKTELISGLDHPVWPAPSTPDEVAAAIVNAAVSKKRHVYVPWYGGLLANMPWLMPHALSVWIAKLAGVDHLLKPTDLNARAAYRQRNFEE